MGNVSTNITCLRHFLPVNSNIEVTKVAERRNIGSNWNFVD